MVGALVRGDHATFILTMDGRLSGWRFRDREGLAWAVEDAMATLDRAKALKRGFLDFLYGSFDAMRHRVMEPAYAARVTLLDDPRAPGVRIAREAVGRPFFSADELP